MQSRLLTTPLNPQSLVDGVMERIEAAIMTGEIAGGAKLNEQPLAMDLGVSRSVVREAIRRLEGRQLISRTPHIGARVATLSEQDLVEIMEVREALEGIACCLAAEKMTDKEIRNLYDVIQSRHKMKQEQNGPTMFLDRNDLDFHHAIVLGSKNKRLEQFLSGDLYYLLKVYRFRSGSQPDRAQDVLLEHMAIADAVAARDAVLAETLMRRHIRIARDSMVRQFAQKAVESAAAEVNGWEKPSRRRGRRKEGKPAVSAAEG